MKKLDWYTITEAWIEMFEQESESKDFKSNEDKILNVEPGFALFHLDRLPQNHKIFLFVLAIFPIYLHLSWIFSNEIVIGGRIGNGFATLKDIGSLFMTGFANLFCIVPFHFPRMWWSVVGNLAEGTPEKYGLKNLLHFWMILLISFGPPLLIFFAKAN